MGTPENFTDKVTVNVVTEVFKVCLNSLSKADEWFKDKQKKYDFIGSAGRKYSERIEERYNIMRIFGMNKPVLLRSIYTRVNILEKITAQQHATVENLEQLFDRDRRTFGVTQETKTGIQAVKDVQKFMVLGKPGSGKTTYLKYIALQAIDGKLGKDLVPIFITLKDLADSGDSLMDYIVEQFDICQIPDAGVFIERILEQGRSIILLDGLDEVNQDRFDDVIGQIQKFSDKYSDNHFIISCRIASYNYCFVHFTDVELADFTDKQIRVFVNNWFGRGTKKAKLCWKELEEKPQIKELASNPLLLTMLCLTFDERMEFPPNRAELYGEAIDALLKKWDTSRSIRRDEIYKDLSTKRKESMFSRIANETFEDDEYFIPQRKLEKHIANFIQHLPGIDPEKLEPDSEVILKSIEAQHGIFVERAKRIYSFSHLTFQEYFTAKYIVDNATKGTLESLVKNHMTSDKWREVFLITTEMLDDADDFFKQMKQRIDDELVNNEDLCTLLTQIQTQVIKKDSPNSLPVLMSLGISYIFASVLALDRAYDLALDLDHVAGARALALARDLALDRALDRDRDLDRALDRALDRDLDLASILALDRLTAMNQYIRMNQWCLDCLNTECYLSKETRQMILESLVTVPSDSLRQS